MSVLKGEKMTRERIRLRICEDDNGCWIWVGARSKQGYGNVSVGGRCLRAHRVSYEVFRGPIPVGLQIDHLCRVRACVNPDHLEAVTQQENMRRGFGASARNARKNVCIRGHDLTGDNARIRATGWRYCGACHDERCAERHRRNREEDNQKMREYRRRVAHVA